MAAHRGMVMVRRALLMLVLSGCDSLFNLDHVPPGGSNAGDDDARPSGDAVGGSGDAAVCGNFDEDGDGKMDGCDRCPTMPGTDADMDMDGLPDACDPNLGLNNKDRILFAAMFSTQADLDDHFNMPVGGVDYFGTQSMISVYGSGSGPAALVTNVAYSPTKIELRVAGMTGITYADTVAIVEPSVTCQLHGTGCDMANPNQTCFFMVSNQSGTHTGAPSTVTRIDLYSDVGDAATSCRVNSTTIGGGGPLSQSTIEVTASANASLRILSMVVYGSGS